MNIRNRNLGVRRVKASELVPHPRNWRLHPRHQRDALRAILDEVGFVGTLLAYELPDGRLQLIDGHLRGDTLADNEVDVCVVDLTPAEADKVLATHDPLTALAEADQAQLDELLRQIDIRAPAIQQMLDELGGGSEFQVPGSKLREKSLARPATGNPDPGTRIPEAYSVVVECAGESQQREVYERLSAEGFKCRLLVM